MYNLNKSEGIYIATMEETRVLFLGGEDPLEKEMATHSSILDRKIPWTQEPVAWATVPGVAKSWTRQNG